ncbi:MAG: phosphoribosylformylglycinamidine synthase I [Candidatus Poriferisodalaceae bacterium]|jgi:phosphoribosylformylglycinamidine synthase subunit PurQ / glutaminase
MTTRIGVVQFPGTNCEFDTADALRLVGAEPVALWHGDSDLDGVDAVIIPGGFAHGDYLRPGAIARFSPMMEAVRDHADEGRPVIGVCNGFQVLTEAGLLPGALQKNAGLKFVCAPAELQVVSTRHALGAELAVGDRLTIPINHFEGNFVCDDSTLGELRDNDQIVLRYVANPNGSVDDIAGVSNQAGNVVGMMPHPERATSPLLGSEDGMRLLRGLLAVAGV